MKIWQIMLAAWLVITGVLMMLSVTFPGMNVLMGILAIFTGILALIDR